MKKLVCLLVDDDAEELEIFRFALEELDRPVVCDSAKSGKEALKYLLAKPRPDYIFLDMNMPTMDGKQCLVAIRKLCADFPIPIILYSTAFIEQQKKDLSSIGATGFLTKAATVHELRDKLNELFEERNPTHHRLQAS